MVFRSVSLCVCSLVLSFSLVFVICRSGKVDVREFCLLFYMRF